MKSITYIAPHKTALTVAVVVAIASLVMMIPMILMFALIPVEAEGQGMASVFSVMMIVMPWMQVVFAYLIVAVMAWLYNLVARRTGGISYESSQQ